jgi:hypothetical protein
MPMPGSTSFPGMLARQSIGVGGPFNLLSYLQLRSKEGAGRAPSLSSIPPVIARLPPSPCHCEERSDEAIS